MQSILEEFARGNISPDVRFFKRNSEYGKAMKILSDREEKLLSTLGMLMTMEVFAGKEDLIVGGEGC